MSETRKVAYSDQVPHGAPEGSLSPRAAYVKGLEAERESVVNRTDDTGKRRLGEIDAQLREYGANPTEGQARRGKAETAVAGPDKG